MGGAEGPVGHRGKEEETQERCRASGLGDCVAFSSMETGQQYSPAVVHTEGLAGGIASAKPRGWKGLHAFRDPKGGPVAGQLRGGEALSA